MIDRQRSSVCSPGVLLCLTALISSSSINEEEKKGEGEIYDFLEALVYHAHAVNPIFPIPVRPGEEGGIELCDAGRETGGSPYGSEWGFRSRNE